MNIYLLINDKKKEKIGNNNFGQRGDDNQISQDIETKIGKNRLTEGWFVSGEELAKILRGQRKLGGFWVLPEIQFKFNLNRKEIKQLIIRELRHFRDLGVVLRPFLRFVAQVQFFSIYMFFFKLHIII